MFGTVLLLSPKLADGDEDHADAADRRDLHPVQLLPRSASSIARPCGARARHSPPAGAGADGGCRWRCASTSSRSDRSGRTATSSGPRAGSSEAVVVDPSGDATELRLTLARLGARCTAILVTHGHFDHLLGVADLAEGTGAPVHMPEGERTLLESPQGVTPAV